ncbi:pilus assembly protein PilM [Candidatus Gottesmanbacteria bacterium]|nr:pilus assembly protein PilM [Candidatus Gottesmanbacteria bacterium]
MVSLPDLILPKVRHFGLSIDRTTIRATELNSVGAVRALAEVRFPEELFVRGVLVKPDTFITALKNLYTAGKFTTPFVTVCFPEAYAYTRETTMPKVPFEEVHEAIGWQTTNLFPFPKEDIYFDWKILQSDKKEYQLAVVAVQKSVLDPLVDAILHAGLKPLRFEPDASAIARLVHLQNDTYALVTDINPRGAYVTLVEGEKAIFTTAISLSSTDTHDIYLANIAQSIKEIGAYYKQKNIITDGISVILTGEFATQEQVKQMASSLPYPTKILNTQIQNPSFNKAYAAATASFAPPLDERSINLIPVNLQKQYDEERESLLYRRLLIRFTIIISVLSVLTISSFLAIKFEEQQVSSDIKSLQNIVKLEGSNQQNLLLLNAQAQTIVRLAPLRITPKQKLIAIASLLTDAIKVTQWEYDDAKLQFTFIGTAKTREDLLSLKNRIEESEEFIKVTLPLASLESSENVKFSMTFITR